VARYDVLRNFRTNVLSIGFGRDIDPVESSNSNENRFSMGFKSIEKICNRRRATVDRFSQVDVEQILSDRRAQFKSEVPSTRHRNVHRCGNMAVMFSGHSLPLGIKNYI
jgi:hypothetical protein